jgi:hypothetical protein
VHPGETVVVQTQPQLPFRMTRLALSPEIADYLEIADVQIGHTSSVLNCVPIPGAMFAHTWREELTSMTPDRQEAFTKALDRLGRIFPGTCEVAQTIRVRATNIGHVSINFVGALYGHHMIPS